MDGEIFEDLRKDQGPTVNGLENTYHQKIINYIYLRVLELAKKSFFSPIIIIDDPTLDIKWPENFSDKDSQAG